MHKTYINWEQLHNDIRVLAKCINNNVDAIIGVGRGGLIPATLLAYKLNVKIINNFQLQSYNDKDVSEQFKLWQTPEDSFVDYHTGDKTILVVDDISDKGNTLAYIKRYFENTDVKLYFVTLCIKEGTSFVPDLYLRRYSNEDWVVFPWEEENTPCTLCTKQLYFNY